MFNLFLIVCFDLMIPILYFVQRNEVKPKKNIILGVTLTPTAQQDERVLAVCKTYLRRLRLVCAVLFVLPFGYMLAYHYKMSLKGFWIGLAVSFLAMCTLFLIVIYRKFKQLKRVYTD